MKKNNTNSYKLSQCYPASYDSPAYTGKRITEKFTATSETQMQETLSLIKSSFQEKINSFFSDKTYAFLGGVSIAVIIIILFMLLGGSGRNRRRSDYD